MNAPPLIAATDAGLHCEPGGFHVDAWRPVERCVVTHAHSDHARAGSRSYLCATEGVAVLRARLGPDAAVEGIAYGERRSIGDVTVSLHPAGHLLGSAQVRVEHHGRVVVVSGDYKTAPDTTCRPFEPLRCDEFITESTFGLPIYRWPADRDVFDDMNAWWRGNVEAGRTSVVFAYALGKAQRVLSGLDAGIGPILLHRAVHRMTQVYRASGVALPPAEHATDALARSARGRALVIAPPSAAGTPWLRKFGPASLAMASGWMAVRGTRRRRALDRGFVLSDHADWPALLNTIAATGATRVGVTHGYTAPLVRYLTERGPDAYTIATRFEGELDAPADAADEADTTAAGANGGDAT